MSSLIEELKEGPKSVLYLVVGLVVALVLLVLVTLYFGGMASYGLEGYQCEASGQGMASGGSVRCLQKSPGFDSEGMQARLGSENYMGNLEGMAGGVPSDNSAAIAQAIRADLAGLNQVGSVNLQNCNVSPLVNADPWLYMNSVEKAARASGDNAAPMMSVDPHDVQGTAYASEGYETGAAGHQNPHADNNLVFALNGGSVSSRR